MQICCGMKSGRLVWQAALNETGRPMRSRSTWVAIARPRGPTAPTAIVHGWSHQALQSSKHEQQHRHCDERSHHRNARYQRHQKHHSNKQRPQHEVECNDFQALCFGERFHSRTLLHPCEPPRRGHPGPLILNVWIAKPCRGQLADMIAADCRVLTWNLWWRFGNWQQRLPLITDTIAGTGADLILLQESWHDGNTSQPEMLADAAGLAHVVWSVNRQPDQWRTRVPGPNKDLDCGLAVLSRWPITNIEEIDLPAGKHAAHGRTALGTLVAHPRGPLPVITTHLEPHPARSALRLQQLNAVATLANKMMDLAGDRSLAPIVGGDFNAEPHSDEVRRFSGLQTSPHIEDLAFQDAWHTAGDETAPGWTWRKDNRHLPAGSANARIDYVFIGLRGRVASTQLIGATNGSTPPSDHAGVIADLRP